MTDVEVEHTDQDERQEHQQPSILRVSSLLSYLSNSRTTYKHTPLYTQSATMTTDTMDASNYYYTLVAKYAKERITIDSLPPSTTIGQVKDVIAEKTSIRPVRQKLLGLTTKSKEPLTDDTTLSDLKVKKPSKEGSAVVHEFILMGTKEEEIFVDPSEKDDLPDVVSLP